MRKESHSLRCTILAIRPDTLSSRTDIYFIKPQDLLALYKAICAWRFIKDRRLSRSEILNVYSLHLQEERGGKVIPESNISTGDGTRSRPDDPPACIGWKPKERKKEHLRNTTFHKGGIFTQKHKSSD
jgi:hypothetical protein